MRAEESRLEGEPGTRRHFFNVGFKGQRAILHARGGEPGDQATVNRVIIRLCIQLLQEAIHKCNSALTGIIKTHGL